MNANSKHDGALTRAAGLTRLAIGFAIAVALLALRVVDPVRFAWLPFRSSCGAFTGLPCIFCGTTRALHHLLQGEFAHALYYNWIAFPVLLIAMAAIGLLATEAITRQRLIVARPAFRVTPRNAAWAGGVLTVVWILQVSLALSFHKRELLNPSAPLYALFVK